MHVIVRRERPHLGARLTLFEQRDGWRYIAFVSNTQVGALQWLEARHRAHALVQDRIRCTKDIGLGRLLSRGFVALDGEIANHNIGKQVTDMGNRVNNSS